MIKEKSIDYAIGEILSELKTRLYSESTIDCYKIYYGQLTRYMKDKNILCFTAKVGLDFLEFKYNLNFDNYYGVYSRKVNAALRCIYVLKQYYKYGEVHLEVRPIKKIPQCPKKFIEEYNKFTLLLKERDYANTTTEDLLSVIKKLLNFLIAIKIKSSKDIKYKHVSAFLTRYDNHSPKYFSKIVFSLRVYLKFIFEEKYVERDLSQNLPRIRIIRNSFIPPVWKTEDVKKLMSAIDRENPEGKRIYAILLIVVRLGLRLSDVKDLELKDLDWEHKKISIIMKKTKKLLELPLLDDVGWAIIDYLKNGRPFTKSKKIFVRHKAPYTAFSHSHNFGRTIHKYMKLAGIKISSKNSYGLHSLRGTLSQTLLNEETPLPIISEILGHQNIKTTSIYIKIDIKGLRRCIVDPDEVFNDEN
jgi:site-specific recombinase XerD